MSKKPNKSNNPKPDNLKSESETLIAIANEENETVVSEEITEPSTLNNTVEEDLQPHEAGETVNEPQEQLHQEELQPELKPIRVQATKKMHLERRGMTIQLTPGKIFTGRLANYLLSVGAPVIEI
jgi:hypothetical protein